MFLTESQSFFQMSEGFLAKNRKVYIKFATIEGNKNSKLLEKLKTRAKKLPPDSNGIL